MSRLKIGTHFLKWSQFCQHMCSSNTLSFAIFKSTSPFQRWRPIQFNKNKSLWRKDAFWQVWSNFVSFLLNWHLFHYIKIIYSNFWASIPRNQKTTVFRLVYFKHQLYRTYITSIYFLKWFKNVKNEDSIFIR